MSMANSLEVRIPFLDKEVIDATEHLYSELGHTHGNLKYNLKQEIFKYLPESLIDLNKRGFTPPLVKWLEFELRSEVESMFEKLNIFNVQVHKLYFQDRSISLEHFCTIYVLLKWFNNNIN